MKALDTPVLLSILHGESGAKTLVRRLRGSEVATTELNLLELSWLAGGSAGKGRAHRLGVLARLGRTMTILPYDRRAGERLAIHLAKDDLRDVPPLVAGMLAILEANGCEEWITTARGVGGGRWSFRVAEMGVSEA
jgi:predicted nucleic acid-binding protein